MAPQNDPPATPKDATQVTEEQRAEQRLWEQRDDDPDAPGRHLDRHGIPDES